MNQMPVRRWWYIIPVAVVMYMLAYMDRINVSMILPYIDDSFHLSSSAAGFASGIFFVGYMILQIPGGYLASRWSAKKVVFILMILWGLSAMATGLVQTSSQLYLARLVLGIFEGGVWPGVLVLLASWFADEERARANALWMTCLPISAVIMAPLTGWLLTFLNWREIFLIEGAPPIIWAIVWLLVVPDKPRMARWLTDAEKEVTERTLASENAGKPEDQGLRVALKNKTVWWLIVAYFFWMSGFYGFSLWEPSVVKSFQGIASPGTVGFLSAIPFLFALLSMIVTSYLSDKTGNRRLFVAVPLIIGTVGLVAGQVIGNNPIVSMVFLVITAIGVYGPYGPFWAIPSRILRIEIVGAAMGLINAIGNLGGFLGPYLVGYLKGITHSSFVGFYVLAAFLVIAMLVTPMLKSDTDSSTDAIEEAVRL
ncbi:MFS transporter [Alicyclobacillus kakegawensis]|uniref:MFS transporter n=1 Tax=Alicyclobacillus kakegawensis TaxID=392012 RepID=UPI000B32CCA8|nr:MFS transporter [Alicyclobacillus kakegawensis]